ncbi:transcription-associated protein 1 [Marasmius crinis-equi]|uniref:Transcription-associated protein 1 n=1 Tax=Marasmius crinis-equi TaxID=585013 RepID=A0ABR3EW34_9AGAR
MDSRLLSIDLLQVVFNWEQKAKEESRDKMVTDDTTQSFTPLGYRENMVSYLVRISTLNNEIPGRNAIMARAIPVLQQMIGPNGWTDVAFGLRYFSKVLEGDLSSEALLSHAVASAKTLQIIAAEQEDAWYTANAATLEKLFNAPSNPAFTDDTAQSFTPSGYRENMVSYLVRISTLNNEIPGRNAIMARAIPVLQQMIGPNGWTDVAFGLRYFSKVLEGDLSSEALLSHAVASAKTLQIFAAAQDDAWYTANAATLEKLVRKGMTCEDAGLHDALYPIFDRLVRLFPLPKEEEEQTSELSDFHSFIHSAIGEGLRNTTTLRGVLLMLKSVVEVVPERIETFSQLLMKLLGKVLKEHTNAPLYAVLDSSARLLISILEICELSMGSLGEQRKWMLSSLVVMVEK